MRIKTILLLFLAIIACLSIIQGAEAFAAQPRYTYIDLVRNNTNPSFVDDRSLVVGQSQFSSPGIFHAFLWKKDTRQMTDLGALSQLGGPFADLDRSQAWALSSYGKAQGCDNNTDRCGDDRDRDGDRNRCGDDRDRCGDRNYCDNDKDRSGDQNRCGDDRDRNRCGDDGDRNCGGTTGSNGVTVVGQAWNLDWEVGGPTARARAFLWDQNKGMTDLGTLGGDYSSANGINARGWVVGYGSNPSFDAHACYWPGTTSAQDIDNRPGKYSSAYAINGQNQIAGIAETETPGIFHGFSWQPGQSMQDLAPVPGGTQSVAFGLNNLAAVCGYSDNAAGDLRAVLWQMAHPGAVDLGDLGGNFNLALSVNDAAQVVGLSSINTGDSHAFIWTKGVGMEDLNPLVSGLPRNITLTLAYSINNLGEIAVQAEGPNGYVHSYLLIPTSGQGGSGRDGGSNQDDGDRDNHNRDRQGDRDKGGDRNRH